MKLINVEKILWALEEEKDEITLTQEIIQKARSSIEKMLALS